MSVPGATLRRKTTRLATCGVERWLAALGLLTLLAPPAMQADQGVYTAVPIKRAEAQLLAAARHLEVLAERHGGLYLHPELNELVRRIGSRVAPPSTDPYLEYRFHILLDPHASAFALPDGQVFVTVGLLTALENEAQLAALLAHEAHHAAGHHGIRRHRAKRKRGGFARTFKLAAGLALEEAEILEEGETETWDFDPPRFELEQAYTQPAIRGYSRELEQEADEGAFRSVAAVGYDVRESSRLYEILGRYTDRAPGAVETKWSAHPRLLERAAAWRQAASGLVEESDLGALESGAESYRDLRWRVALDTVHGYLRREELDSAVAVAEGLVEERPDNPEAVSALAEARRAHKVRSDLLGPDAVSAAPEAGPWLPLPDPACGSIGLTVRAARRVGRRTWAEEVFFVRIEEGQEGFAATELIPSSHSSNQQVYLLNVEPGRYVAVAAVFSLSEGATAYFSTALIDATEVDVTPSEMAFMGEFHVRNSSVKERKADPAQAHYFRLLNLGGADTPIWVRKLGGYRIRATSPESVASDPATERAFWATARDAVFSHDPRWQVRAARQLAGISKQDPN